MNEEQLSALQDALEEFRKNGELSAEALSRLKDSTDPATKAFNKFEQGLKSVTRGLGSAANSLAKSDGAINNMNSSVDAVTGGISAVAKNFGLAGRAVSLVTDALGGYAKFVMNQLTEMQTHYTALGDIGAVAENGITGFQEMFRAGGLATANFGNFSKALSENTTGMAIFASGMSDSGMKFAEVAGALTSGDIVRRFARLGIGVDSVTKSAAQYVANSTRLGLTYSKTQEQVIASTQKYIEEVDLIARMTGQSRAAQEEEARKTMTDARFRAKLTEMELEGRGAEADQLRRLAEGLGGPAGQAVREIAVFGVALSKTSADANLLSRDALRQTTQAVANGRMQATKGIESVAEGYAQGSKTFRTTIKAAGNELESSVQALDFEQLIRFRDKLENEFGRSVTLEEAAQVKQKRLLDGVDKSTRSFADAQVNVAEAGKNVKTLQMALAINAIPAVNTFADALNGLSGWINTNILKITPPSPAGATKGPGAALGGRRSTPSGTVGDAGLKGLAAKNLNPGNLRFIGQAGAVEGVGGFAKFETLEAGYEALAKDLYAKLTGKSSAAALKDGATVAKLISVYAPPNENDTQAYINNVSKYMNIDPNTPLGGDPKTLAKLMVAVLGQENLGDPSRVTVAQKKSIQMAVAQTLAMQDVIPLNEFQKGGISTGPNTGYQATLHGTEAVIPLPDGKTIPVTLSGYNEMMTQQIGQLDELISIMRSQVDLSAKILQVSQ